MSTKKKVLAISLALLLLAGGGAFAWWQFIREDDVTKEFKPKAEEGQATPPASESEPIATPDIETTSNLTIDNLSNGDKIRPGTIVRGKALSFDGILHITIKGSVNGKIADYTVNIAKSDTEPQPYSVEIIFERQHQPGEKAVLDVYTEQDNVRAHSKQLEVILQ